MNIGIKNSTAGMMEALRLPSESGSVTLTALMALSQPVAGVIVGVRDGDGVTEVVPVGEPLLVDVAVDEEVGVCVEEGVVEGVTSSLRKLDGEAPSLSEEVAVREKDTVVEAVREKDCVSDTVIEAVCDVVCVSELVSVPEPVAVGVGDGVGVFDLETVGEKDAEAPIERVVVPVTLLVLVRVAVPVDVMEPVGELVDVPDFVPDGVALGVAVSELEPVGILVKEGVGVIDADKELEDQRESVAVGDCVAVVDAVPDGVIETVEVSVPEHVPEGVGVAV